MPNISPLPPNQASVEAQAIYDDFYHRMSFPGPPNFILTQGHSPAVAAGTWGLVRNVLIGGVIPRWLKEVMFVAISADRNCRYCDAAHRACCRMLGMAPAAVDALVRNLEANLGGKESTKQHEMVQFARACARDPQGVSPADFARLRNVGLTEGEIIEIVAMAALAVYANIVADATRMEADEMFGQL